MTERRMLAPNVRWRRRLAWLLLLVMLAATAGTGGWWYANRQRGTEQPGQGPGEAATPAPGGGGGRGSGQPLTVEVQSVERGPIRQLLELSGEVMATDAVVIAAAKEGPITKCSWREGDRVQAGETLVEIDREVHRAELRAAEAALAVARGKLADLEAGSRPEERERARAMVQRWRASLAEAERNWEREQRLLAQNGTSQQSLEEAQERREVAEAELIAARESLQMLEAGATATERAVQELAVEEAAARVELAGAHLAECRITAPFDGVISKVHVRAGDLAVPRNPLMEMYAPDSLVIRFSVAESHAAAVRPGLPLRVTLDALPGQELPAEVERVYPQLEETTRLRTVDAVLTASAELLPHMFARLSLELQQVPDALLIPAEAVLTSPSGASFVFVAQQGQAERREVEIGIQQASMIQVLGGLQPEERVIVAGQAALRDGQPIRAAGQTRPDRQPAAAEPGMEQRGAGKGGGRGKGGG